ncbi:MAG: SDR family NAD(P)-dependent oxidoreductase [Bryobacteraceae bacterium]
MGKLDGKVAVITGATSGIGAETARVFIAEGARVILGGRRQKLCADLAAELGPAAVPLTIDVTRENDLAQAADLAMSQFGRLDCFVNNAGSAGVLGPIEQTPAADLDETISVLFRSVVLGTKHATRVMRPQKFGTVINNASVAGFFTGYAPHVYSACKAAVIQLTRSVATELGELGIRVNCVCPGPIPTPIFGTAFGLPAHGADELAATLKHSFADIQPLHRSGEALDIAKAVLWLASDDASFVNGHALVVDGGLTLGRSWSAMQQYFGEMVNLVPQKPREESAP